MMNILIQYTGVVQFRYNICSFKSGYVCKLDVLYKGTV